LLTETLTSRFGEEEEPIVAAIMTKLGAVLDLDHTCGFLRFVKLRGEWLPQSLSLGIPAHNRKVNAEVLGAIREKGLLREESLAIHATAMEKLRCDLEAFVLEMQGVVEGDGPALVRGASDPWEASNMPPAPARLVVFNGAQALPQNLRG